MYQIVAPRATTFQTDTFTSWLDKRNLTWTQNNGTINLWCDDATLEVVKACCDAIFGAFTLSLGVPTVPAAIEGTDADTPSWYQYAARVGAITGQVIRTGEMDTPVRWTEKGDDYIFIVKRVAFRETARRYIVTGTHLEMVRLYRVGNKWETDITRMPCELAPDLIKFGNIVTSSQYWQRRADNAAHIDWSKPALAAALKREASK
jgi:hypothetical protein